MNCSLKKQKLARVIYVRAPLRAIEKNPFLICDWLFIHVTNPSRDSLVRKGHCFTISATPERHLVFSQHTHFIRCLQAGCLDLLLRRTCLYVS
jgi:hypothetical protein